MPAGTKTRQLLDQATAAGKPLTRQYQDKNGRWRRSRDSQRSKVYAAEQAALRGSQPLSAAEAKELIVKIRTSKYVLKNYGDPGHVRLEVTARRTRTSVARPYEGSISLAAGWGLCADVVIHEMAHMYATPAGDPGHDWLFCHIYLDFVRKFMGKAEADKLKAAFKSRKVRFTPPRKRKPMSAAQKQAARDRMAKARAAKGGKSIEPHVIAVMGPTRWALIAGSTVPKSGWLKTTLRPSKALTRSTQAGIDKALAAIKTWPGEAAASAVAIPVSQLQTNGYGMLDLDWEPVGAYS